MTHEVEEWRDEMDAYRMKGLSEIFAKPKPVIGMVHLPPRESGQRGSSQTHYGLSGKSS